MMLRLSHLRLPKAANADVGLWLPGHLIGDQHLGKG